MLAPVRTVAPTDAMLEGILAPLREHCRVDFDDDDKKLRRHIRAAYDHIDAYSGIAGRALFTQTWRQDYDGFGCILRLPFGPVQSVSSVTYYDGNNASQTLSASVYTLFTDESGPYLDTNPAQSWPGTYSRPDAVRVTFVAGYGATPDSIPGSILNALLMIAAHYYANPSAVSDKPNLNELPLGVRALLAPYRRVGF